MNGWWQLWGSYFSPDECQTIVAQGLKIQPSRAAVGHGSDNRMDDNYRRSEIRWIGRQDASWRWLTDKMEHAFQVANGNAFGFDLTYFHEIQFTEYNSAYKGKYDWHEDVFWVTKDQCHRKLSMVIQLSDPNDYEGGALNVQEQPPDPVKLQRQGTVLIFPSFLRHRVEPVTRGIRYSLVSWYMGPKFK